MDVNWTESAPDLFTLQTMPRGSETGIWVHQLFEKLFSQRIWHSPAALSALIAEELRFSALAPWQKPIEQMVQQTLSMPLLAGFSLSEVEQFQVEMEFVFSSAPHFIKGFIDFVFLFQDKVYFLDWKTNWLEDYGQISLQKAMQAHDYGLQASLYAEAIRRHFKKEYGGAFYVFVRGGAYLKIEAL